MAIVELADEGVEIGERIEFAVFAFGFRFGFVFFGGGFGDGGGASLHNVTIIDFIFIGSSL